MVYLDGISNVIFNSSPLVDIVCLMYIYNINFIYLPLYKNKRYMKNES